MPRLSILNFLLGFLAIFFAASSGLFIANDMSQAYISNNEMLKSWQMTLLKSAHGHTNLFGILQILLGITIPYSNLSYKIKVFQTWAIFAGTLTMSLLLCLRAFRSPYFGYDFLGLLIGALLSGSLISLALHCYGLLLKLKNI